MQLSTLKSRKIDSIKAYKYMLLLSLFVVAFCTYQVFSDLHKMFIEEQIKSEINIHKNKLLFSLNESRETFNRQQQTFLNIHNLALNDYREQKKKSNKVSLVNLKQRIKSNHQLKNVDIDLFLIDKKGVIFDATVKKDLGLDLSQHKSVDKILKRTFKTGLIYFSEKIALDPLDLKLKLYSYAKLDEDTILELGFIFDPLSNQTYSLLNKSLQHPAKIYIVFDRGQDNYRFFQLNDNNNVQTKKQFYSRKTTFSSSKSNNPVAQTFLTQKNIIQKHGDKLKVFVNLKTEKNANFESNNFVIEFDAHKVMDHPYFDKLFLWSVLSMLFYGLLALFIYYRLHITSKKPYGAFSDFVKDEKIIPAGVQFYDKDLNQAKEAYNSTLQRKKQLETELEQSMRMCPMLKIGNQITYKDKVNELLDVQQEFQLGFSYLLIQVNNHQTLKGQLELKAFQELLMDFVSTIQDNIKKTDIVYKISVSEFVVLLPNTNITQTKKIVTDINKALKKPRFDLIQYSGAYIEANKIDVISTLYLRAKELQISAKSFKHNFIVPEN